MHIIASDRDDSSEDENMLITAPFTLPKTVPNPNTDSLDVSFFFVGFELSDFGFRGALLNILHALAQGLSKKPGKNVRGQLLV